MDVLLPPEKEPRGSNPLRLLQKYTLSAATYMRTFSNPILLTHSLGRGVAKV